MIDATYAFAPLNADMVRRPRWAAERQPTVQATVPWWQSETARDFAFTFVSGFIFFYTLIA